MSVIPSSKNCDVATLNWALLFAGTYFGGVLATPGIMKYDGLAGPDVFLPSSESSLQA